MKKLAIALLCAPVALTGGSALAQEVAPLPPAQPQPARPLGEVSDEEVSRFAKAALVAEQIYADESLDQTQQQAAIANVMQKTGFDSRRFRQIAAASQSDTALMERIQTAAQQHVAAAQQQQQ